MHFLCPFLAHNGITSATHNERRGLYARKVLFHAIRKSVLKCADRAWGAGSEVFAHQNRQKGKRLTLNFPSDEHALTSHLPSSIYFLNFLYVNAPLTFSPYTYRLCNKHDSANWLGSGEVH